MSDTTALVLALIRAADTERVRSMESDGGPDAVTVTVLAEPQPNHDQCCSGVDSDGWRWKGEKITSEEITDILFVHFRKAWEGQQAELAHLVSPGAPDLIDAEPLATVTVVRVLGIKQFDPMTPWEVSIKVTRSMADPPCGED